MQLIHYKPSMYLITLYPGDKYSVHRWNDPAAHDLRWMLKSVRFFKADWRTTLSDLHDWKEHGFKHKMIAEVDKRGEAVLKVPKYYICTRVVAPRLYITVNDAGDPSLAALDAGEPVWEFLSEKNAGRTCKKFNRLYPVADLIVLQATQEDLEKFEKLFLPERIP